MANTRASERTINSSVSLRVSFEHGGAIGEERDHLFATANGPVADSFIWDH